MDIDGDGCLSAYEMEYFYQEQLKLLEERGIETVGFEDIFCQL